jgi:ABC-type transport system involved in multi-copper enzyme maturation permease subunit
MQGVGGALFNTISAAAFLFALLSGVFLSSDVISHERREGTLGLLFLTDLGGFDVVSGKLFACGLNAFYGLLSVLPILATSWFLGGVTGGEFLRIAATLVNSLLLSMTVGLWVSTHARAEIQSLGETAAWIAGITLLPVGFLWANAFIGSPTFVYIVCGFSPLTAFLAAPDIKYTSSAPQFWISLAVVHAMSWGLMAHASYRLRRGWRDSGEETSKKDRQHPEATAATPNESARATRRRLERDINPVMVLVENDPRIQRFSWACTVAGYLIQAYLLYVNSGNWILLGALNLALLPMKILIAWKACAFFAAARRDGTMELLLTTPLSDFDLIKGQIEGLKKLFHKPLVALFLGNILMAALVGLVGKTTVSVPGLLDFGGSLIVAGLVGGFYWLVLLMDLRAIYWVGFWLAMTDQRPSMAFVKTLVRVVLLPAVLVCIPNLIINGFQLSWARDKFRMNLRAILQGARNPWPVR